MKKLKRQHAYDHNPAKRRRRVSLSDIDIMVLWISDQRHGDTSDTSFVSKPNARYLVLIPNEHLKSQAETIRQGGLLIPAVQFHFHFSKSVSSTLQHTKKL